MWTAVQRNGITLHSEWVKSHGDEHPEFFLQYSLDITACFGNCCADKLAIKAAAGAEITHAAAALVLQMIAYVQLIQQRLVAILQKLLKDFPRQGTNTGVLRQLQGWQIVPRLPLSRAIFWSPPHPHSRFSHCPLCSLWIICQRESYCTAAVAPVALQWHHACRTSASIGRSASKSAAPVHSASGWQSTACHSLLKGFYTPLLL